MRSSACLCMAAFILALTASCSSRDGLNTIRGKVSIDGKPVESGTIHFQPAQEHDTRGLGTAVIDGAFELHTERKLPPGKYTVSLQAFKKTGRMVNDPQRGRVAEIVPLTAADSPQDVQLTQDISNALTLNFSSSINRQ